MILNNSSIASFQEFIWDFYARAGRTFAWRNIDDPYKILISEVMLQQTQTYRVEPKYEQFIAELPTFNALADASLRDVLSLWQGLGYNRRGQYLHQLGKKVVEEHGGILPSDPTILETFPGIGKATASSICAFAFNQPTIFIETNIRAVFIHSFFQDKDSISDKEIRELVAATVDLYNPREWYYALMDYGVHLKKELSNPSRKSAHYTKQSPFQGSDRQIRGAIIKMLTEHTALTRTDIIEKMGNDKERVDKVIETLIQQSLIMQHNDDLSIA
jgi:A/G-specific adenine glycosylase